MTKQLILIILSTTQKPKGLTVGELKKSIKAYIGTRLLEDDLVDNAMPGLVLKRPLNVEDKKELSALIPESEGVLAFIEFEDSKEANDQDYINAKMVIDNIDD